MLYYPFLIEGYDINHQNAILLATTFSTYWITEKSRN